jgi:hypothetical protein
MWNCSLFSGSRDSEAEQLYEKVEHSERRDSLAAEEEYQE